MKRSREERNDEPASSTEPVRKRAKREHENTPTSDSLTSTTATAATEQPREKASAEDEIQCGICYEGIVLQGKLDTCAHPFCFDCIFRWSMTSNTCPLCKARFNSVTKKRLRGEDAIEAEATAEPEPYLNKPIQVRHRDAHFDDDDYLPTPEEIEEDYRARLRRAYMGGYLDDDEEDDFDDEDEDEEGYFIADEDRASYFHDSFFLPTLTNRHLDYLLGAAAVPGPPPLHLGPMSSLLSSASRLPALTPAHHYPTAFLPAAATAGLPMVSGMCPMVEHLLRFHASLANAAIGLAPMLPLPPAAATTTTSSSAASALPPPPPPPSSSSASPTAGPTTTGAPGGFASSMSAGMTLPPPAPLAVPTRHHHHHHRHFHHHIVHHRGPITTTTSAGAPVGGLHFPVLHQQVFYPPPPPPPATTTTTTTTTTTAGMFPPPLPRSPSYLSPLASLFANGPFAAARSSLSQAPSYSRSPSHPHSPSPSSSAAPVVIDLTTEELDTRLPSYVAPLSSPPTHSTSPRGGGAPAAAMTEGGMNTLPPASNAVAATTPLQTLHPPPTLPSGAARDPFLPTSFSSSTGNAFLYGRTLPPLPSTQPLPSSSSSSSSSPPPSPNLSLPLPSLLRPGSGAPTLPSISLSGERTPGSATDTTARADPPYK